MSASVVEFTLLLFGVGFAIQGYQYGLGSLDAPGDGLFPLLAALAVVASLLYDFTLRVLRRDGVKRFRIAGTAVAAVTLLVVAYAQGLEWIGYPVASLALLVVLWKIAKPSVPWWWTVAVAIGFSVGTYVLFKWVLGVPLPAGVVGL